MPLKLVALVGVAGAAVGIGLAVYLSTGQPTASACGGTASTAVSPAAAQSLAADAGLIRHDVDHSSNGSRAESWDDPLAQRTRQISFDQAGRIVNESATRLNGRTQISTWVDYAGRNWILDRASLPASAAHDQDGAAAVAADYRRGVATGVAKVMGNATVDGRATLHLRQITKVPATPSGGPTTGMPAQRFQIDAWVDPTTYLPVRLRTENAGTWTETKETWLPRTRSNLAELTVVIPAGFRKLHEQANTTALPQASSPLSTCS